MQVLINGMTMAYEEHGAGPAVLLLHGFPFDRGIWKSHIQPLVLAGYRVIVPDLRGFGESSAPAGDYSIDVLSDDVIGLLNCLGIGRAAIVGLSLGAHVLNTLLKRCPQRVAAAVFVDLPGRQVGKAETECLLELVTKRGGERRDEFIDALAEVLLPEAHGAVRQWVKAADDRILSLVLQSMRQRTDAGPAAGHAELPILRLRTGLLDAQNRSEGGTDITRCLLDFFKGVTRFRPRCQIFRQVA